MKILHTSDLHLTPKNPRTLEALREILSVAKQNKVNALTISGDLFDSEEDAEVLRPKLRTKFFSGNDFDIIAIPGNHDREAYRKNLDFGSNLRVLTKTSFDTVSVKDKKVRIIGVPFVDKPSDELFAQLGAVKDEKLVNILLLHCTLNISYAPADFGEEKEGADYFPIDSSVLSRLGFNYILAGHFHTDFIKKDIGDGCLFVYPGSPVSLSWKNIGRRKAAILDTEEGDIKEVFLNSFYYDRLDVQIRPGLETEKLEEIEKWVNDHAAEDCGLKVTVTGYGKMEENEFGKLLKKVAGHAEVENEYRCVKEILRHPLYRDFKRLLDEKEDISEKEDVDYRVIEILSKLKAARKII